MPDWCSSAPGSSPAEPRAGDPPASAQRRRAADAAAHLAGDPAGACAGGLQRRLSVNGGEADTFAKLLFGYGLLQLLFMLRLMPGIFVSRSMLLSGAFRSAFPRWPPPVCISAGRGDGFSSSGDAAIYFSNLVVGLLLLRTALLLVSGKLLLRVDRETLLNKKEGS